MNVPRRHLLALPALLALPPALRAQLRTPEQLEANPRWLQARESLFGQRPIAEGDDFIVLQAPARAEDSAVVPISIAMATAARAGAPAVRQLTLVIDNNPSPVGAVFRYGPASARADLETRVRIDEYTFVRAIAETADGRLHMSKRLVKASGGCSAPPGKDAEAARATLGRMRLAVQPDLGGDGSLRVQLMISHPNDSGLAMDQLTRQYTPAHYVRRIDVSYAGRALLSADVDFTISENPHLRFFLRPEPPGGELRAEVVDTSGRRFEQRLQLAAS